MVASTTSFGDDSSRSNVTPFSQEVRIRQAINRKKTYFINDHKGKHLY